MSTIKTNTKKTEKVEEQPRGWSKIIKHVATRVYSDRNYVLIHLTDEQIEELADAPILPEIREGVMLVNISRFCKFGVAGDLVDQDNAGGKGWANVKLRYASYDYKYKGRTGHTEKLELTGINFLTFESFDGLEGLTDGLDELDDDEDLPF